MTLAEELKENLTEIAENMHKIYEAGFSAGGLNIENGEGEGSLQQKGTSATGYASHSEGSSTHAKGYASHAEGGSTIAEGEGSHAEGSGTHALGTAAHAEGEGTIAGYKAQHVCGTFNENKPDNLLEVGNGTNGKPSNAFEVLKDGRARAYGAAKDPEDLVRLKEFDEALENLPSSDMVSISGQWEFVSCSTVTPKITAVFQSDGDEYYGLQVARNTSNDNSMTVIFYTSNGYKIVYQNGNWTDAAYKVINFGEGKQLISLESYNALVENVQNITYPSRTEYNALSNTVDNINLYSHNITLILDITLGQVGAARVEVYFSLLSRTYSASMTAKQIVHALFDFVGTQDTSRYSASGIIFTNDRKKWYNVYAITPGVTADAGTTADTGGLTIYFNDDTLAGMHKARSYHLTNATLLHDEVVKFI